MAEPESAHGKLTPIDQQWTGPRFMGLLAGTLVVALIVIYSIAAYKFGDWGYRPFAHDPVRHVMESSTIND